MSNRSRSKMRLAAVLLALSSASGLAAAANVGHYEMCNGSGNADLAAAITAAGHTPVSVETPDAAGLAGIETLFVTNCDNGGAGAEYLANMTHITNAVAGGMTLVVHDRWVSSGGSLVPGAGGVIFVRSFSDDFDINFPIGSPILSGPGGTLNNTSLDNGNSSSHGYVSLTTLPAGGTALAVRPTASDGVTVTWGYGSGRVVYSTIPLDCYLSGDCDTPPTFQNVYAPNIIHWATGGSTFTTCAAEGYKTDKLKLCKLICEVPQPQPVIDQYIRLWLIKFGSAPPCAGGSSNAASLVPKAPSASVPPLLRDTGRNTSARQQ